MDASTGLLLVAAPGWVLATLGIDGVPEASLIFLRWIGVFVGSVGLSYALVRRGDREGETVWRITALVRTLVAVFVTASIAAGALVPSWVGVAATDALVAGVQFVGLRRGWWGR